MDKEKNAGKLNIARLLISIILLVVGLITVFPWGGMGNQFKFYFVVIAAILLMVFGVVSLIIAFTKRKKVISVSKSTKEKVKVSKVIIAAIAIIVGILMIVYPQHAAVATFQLVIGAWMIVDGIINFFVRAKLKKSTNKYSVAILICAVIEVVLGAVVLLSTYLIIIKFGYGVALVVFGAVSMITQLLAHTALKNK